MCRNIKTLHNFEPPATRDEICASSLQFVRKLCGFTKPSRANEAVFNRAVDEVAHAAQHLLDSLVTNARSEEHTSELQSHHDLVCRLLLEKKIQHTVLD